MAESPWAHLTQLGKSRPVLLFVILVLCGFLSFHYISPPHNFNVVIADVDVKENVITPYHSAGRKKLLEDSVKLRNFTSRKVKVAENLIAVTVKKKESHSARSTTTTVRPNKMLQAVTRERSYSCKKKINVSFLKVHKAGSTTLMNIFLRFAISHHLNIVLPSKSSGFGFNYLGYGESVSKDRIVPLPANETYNILCNHVVYDRTAFRSVMPPDTDYLGIIREPVSHFTSAASYYGFHNHLLQVTAGKIPSKKVVGIFLKNPAAFKVPTYFVYNRMSYDFGMQTDKFHDELYVQNYIKELEEDYALVMILERFQESLVLMKRTLCWDTKDILYVPLNERTSKVDFDLNEFDIQNLNHWNSADFTLYSHFYEVFNNKISAQGQDLQDEVESFKSIQQEVEKFCNNLYVTPDDPTSVLPVSETKWGTSFVVTRGDCDLMMEPELSMMHRLINDAWAKYNSSLKVLSGQKQNSVDVTKSLV